VLYPILRMFATALSDHISGLQRLCRLPDQPSIGNFLTTRGYWDFTAYSLIQLQLQQLARDLGAFVRIVPQSLNKQSFKIRTPISLITT
jgi:hypothetical protein